jgi:osmotically inducible protein OsmC
VPRIERRAEAVWTGTVARGSGTIAGLSSGAFRLTYDEPTRVADPAGNTSPEELIAAAHAGCFAMSLAAELSRLRVPPERVSVQAKCVMDEVEGRGHLVVASELDVEVTATELDERQLDEAVEKADAGCPISILIRGTAGVTVSARVA